MLFDLGRYNRFPFLGLIADTDTPNTPGWQIQTNTNKSKVRKIFANTNFIWKKMRLFGLFFHFLLAKWLLWGGRQLAMATLADTNKYK